MQLLATAPHGGHQVGRLKHAEVLRHALAGHVEMLAQLVERAPIMVVQQVQELAPAGVGEGLEQQIGVIGALGHEGHRQVTACM
jgi:hypothetical protein